MIRTQISFDEPLYRQAQTEAARQGVSLAELCRRALARALGVSKGSAKQPWSRFSGAIPGGRADESTKENIDGVVYGAKNKR